MLVKDETQVFSRVSGVKQGVIYYRKLLFESNQKKFGFRRVDAH